MKLWLLKDGENLPLQSGVSKMRTWTLAEVMAARGHEVTWWSSTHSHQQKVCLADEDTTYEVGPGIELRMLHCGGYQRNVSIDRIRHHQKLSRRFLSEAERLETPDLLVSSLPLVGWSKASVDYAYRHRIPSVVDIRDPWPDVLQQSFRGIGNLLSRIAFAPMRQTAKSVLRRADHLTAVSSGFLEWGQRLGGRGESNKDAVFPIGRKPPERYSRTIDEQWLIDIPENRLVVCFVGMFGRVYELELVCEAARRLQDFEHAPLFVIAGAGDKFGQVERLTRDLQNVILPGWISRDAAASLMARADIALAPIRHIPGCVPNKIAEYLSHGLPIVTSLEGDLPKLIQQYGFGISYAPGDVSGLVDGIKKMADQPDVRHSMSEAARAVFQSHFAAEQVYDAFAEHLESIVNG